MPRGGLRRNRDAAAELTVDPPDSLSESQLIVRIGKAAGNNMYIVQPPSSSSSSPSSALSSSHSSSSLPSSKELLVELPSKFRSTIWIKRGGFVLIDTSEMSERSNKIDGLIINVIRDLKSWRKMPYWPEEFKPADQYSDEEGGGSDSNDNTDEK